MLVLDRLALRQHHCPLDRILELAHVARPRIGQKRSKRALTEAGNGQIVRFGVLAKEVLRQQGDVAPACSQGGNVQLNHVEPVVQVLPKTSLLDHFHKVAVGGHHHADVYRDRLVAANPLELAFLQKPQQFDLKRQRDLADLVKKQRTARRLFEAPLTPTVGTGKGATLVPEQLGLEQRLRQGSTVEPHKRAVLASRTVVNGSSDQLLARSGLAVDQHGGPAASHLLHQLEKPLHAWMIPNNVFER